jgi:arylsulfatase A-like enzyme
VLLYVHYMDPHEPYYPHPELGDDPPDSESVNLAWAMDRVRADHARRPTDAQMRWLRHRYANEVRFADAHLGRLVEAFRHRFGPESAIVLVADHGEEFLDHGELGHGGSLHRELVHVPLVMDLPGALPAERRRQRIEAPISLVDVLPTLLEALRVPADAGSDGFAMDGGSWLACLRGEAPPPDRPLFASQSHFGRRIYRWREGAHSLVITFDHGRDKRELFDLAADPTEQHDALATLAGVHEPLSARFEASLAAQEKGRDPRPSENRASPESLRALGYVQ